MRSSTVSCLFGFVLLSAARPAFAAPPQFAFCFSYEHDQKPSIRVSQIVPISAPEMRGEVYERIVQPQSALEASESGCSVSSSLEEAMTERASFVANGGYARTRWLRHLPVREVTIDTTGLEERDRLYLADAEAAAKGEPMYVACYVHAGPDRYPVLLAAPFLSRRAGSEQVKEAMRTVPSYESYVTPECEAHADRETASAFLKEGIALAASYRVPTAELKINGQ